MLALYKPNREWYIHMINTSRSLIHIYFTAQILYSIDDKSLLPCVYVTSHKMLINYFNLKHLDRFT